MVTGSTASGVVVANRTCPARTSVPAGSPSGGSNGPLALLTVIRPRPGVGGCSEMPSMVRNFSRLASGIRLLR